MAQLYVLIQRTLELLAILVISIVILRFQVWLILAVFVFIFVIMLPVIFLSTRGVQGYVKEREDAQNEWVFFTKQALTVLPSARIYGLEGILLERLEVRTAASLALTCAASAFRHCE